MNLDTDLRRLMNDTSSHFRPASGDLEVVVRRGRRRRTRRRVGEAAAVAVLMAVVGVAALAARGPHSIASNQVATTMTTVGDGLRMVIPEGVPLRETTVIDGAGGFTILEKTSPNGFWSRIGHRLGLSPDLVVYSSDDGKAWTSRGISAAVIEDADSIVHGIRVGDQYFLLVSSTDATGPFSEAHAYSILSTADFVEWEQLEIDLPLPEDPLPPELQWKVLGVGLIPGGSSVALRYEVFPEIMHPETYRASGFDRASGWSMTTADGATTRIPIQRVFPTGASFDRTILATLVDGSVKPMPAVPIDTNSFVTDLWTDGGTWLALTSGADVDTPGHSATLWRSTGSDWSIVAQVDVDAASLLDGLLHTVDVDESGWQITRWSDDGASSLDLGGRFGEGDALGSLAPALVGSSGSLVAVSGRTVWEYDVDADGWVAHQLESVGWETLPTGLENSTSPAWAASVQERLATDENQLVPRRIAGSALLGMRSIEPSDWWVFLFG